MKIIDMICRVISELNWWQKILCALAVLAVWFGIILLAYVVTI